MSRDRASRPAPRTRVGAARRRAGTTVLELVVALVVTGAVAAAGAAAFRQAIDRRVQLLSSSTSTERSAALRAMLREWLSAGTLVWPSSEPGISFTTTAHVPLGQAGVPLRLYIDDDAATPESGLTLATRPPTASAAVRRELDAAITGMLVEYLDTDTRQWVPALDASSRRPLAVRLTFPGAASEIDATIPGDRLQALPLTIVLPDTAEPLRDRTPANAPLGAR